MNSTIKLDRYGEIEQGLSRLRAVLQMTGDYMDSPKREDIDTSIISEALTMMTEAVAVAEGATDWACSDYVEVCRALDAMRKDAAAPQAQATVPAKIRKVA